MTEVGMAPWKWYFSHSGPQEIKNRGGVLGSYLPPKVFKVLGLYWD